MLKVKERMSTLVRNLVKRRKRKLEIKRYTQSKERESARCVWDLENEG